MVPKVRYVIAPAYLTLCHPHPRVVFLLPTPSSIQICSLLSSFLPHKLPPFGPRLLAVYEKKEERLRAKGKYPRATPFALAGPPAVATPVNKVQRPPPLPARLVAEPGSTPDDPGRLKMQVTGVPGGNTPVPPTPKKLAFEKLNAASPSPDGK